MSIPERCPVIAAMIYRRRIVDIKSRAEHQMVKHHIISTTSHPQTPLLTPIVHRKKPTRPPATPNHPLESRTTRTNKLGHTRLLGIGYSLINPHSSFTLIHSINPLFLDSRCSIHLFPFTHFLPIDSHSRFHPSILNTESPAPPRPTPANKLALPVSPSRSPMHAYTHGIIAAFVGNAQ